MSDKALKRVRKMSGEEISMYLYNKKCDEIIKKGKDIDETLIELLDMAMEFTIKRRLPIGKRRTNGHR